VILYTPDLLLATPYMVLRIASMALDVAVMVAAGTHMLFYAS
jgi:hypothetical protein